MIFTPRIYRCSASGVAGRLEAKMKKGVSVGYGDGFSTGFPDKSAAFPVAQPVKSGPGSFSYFRMRISQRTKSGEFHAFFIPLQRKGKRVDIVKIGHRHRHAKLFVRIYRLMRNRETNGRFCEGKTSQ